MVFKKALAQETVCEIVCFKFSPNIINVYSV